MLKVLGRSCKYQKVSVFDDVLDCSVAAKSRCNNDLQDIAPPFGHGAAHTFASLILGNLLTAKTLAEFYLPVGNEPFATAIN